MSDETQDSARQLERVPFRHSLAEVDEIQNPYFIGAPGMNRTCDLRFRKPLLYPLSYEGGGWCEIWCEIRRHTLRHLYRGY
jgi:hypothetical protein